MLIKLTYWLCYFNYGNAYDSIILTNPQRLTWSKQLSVLLGINRASASANCARTCGFLTNFKLLNCKLNYLSLHWLIKSLINLLKLLAYNN